MINTHIVSSEHTNDLAGAIKLHEKTFIEVLSIAKASLATTACPVPRAALPRFLSVGGEHIPF